MFLAINAGENNSGASVRSSPPSSGTPRIIDNRYILDDEWREGGGARVFQAFDRQARETVAVKVLTLQLTPDERILNVEFDREWRSLDRLSHPNIIRFRDGGRDPETREPYFVLDWVDNDLSDALAEAPCADWKEFVELYALPILEGLAYAHEHQVLHRDIKPSNILVTASKIPGSRTLGSPS
jgi:serine/threonine protein kinase